MSDKHGPFLRPRRLKFRDRQTQRAEYRWEATCAHCSQHFTAPTLAELREKLGLTK